MTDRIDSQITFPNRVRIESGDAAPTENYPAGSMYLRSGATPGVFFKNTDESSSSWDTVARGSVLLVAPSDAAPVIQAISDWVCTGSNDDVTINQALGGLPFVGGEVKLLPGNYTLGTGASSFIDGYNTKGGITLSGMSSRQGSIVHVPAGTAAPCAIRLSASAGGRQRVEKIHVAFDDPTNLACDGIQMQSAEGQIVDCTVVKAGRHGFVLDGEPTTRGGTPSQIGTSGLIQNSEAQYCGYGGVEAGDGFQVTALHENANLTNCFVNGGTGSVGATLTTALVQGNSYTTLAVTPLTAGVSSGDQLVISQVGGSANPVRQIVTASASASAGATSISVNNFTANAAYAGNANTYVCDFTIMKTRIGFNIVNTIAHLNNCHPYFCYQSGIGAYQSSVEISGGEYETNGWCNIDLQGSLTPTLVHSSIRGVHTYGKVAFASIHAFGCLLMTVADNYIDGDVCNSTVFLQSCNNCTITGNAILNGGTPFAGSGYSMNVQNSDGTVISHNAIKASNTPGGSRKGIQVFNCTNMTVVGNNIDLASGTPLVQSTNTGCVFRDNRGYNPVGVEVVAVPASGVAVAAVCYDRTYYITAGAGATTVAIQNGPTVTLTASVLNTIRVPANKTLTPTYANAPTWVVESE